MYVGEFHSFRSTMKQLHWHRFIEVFTLLVELSVTAYSHGLVLPNRDSFLPGVIRGYFALVTRP